jgi:hypothetical protein
MQYLVESDKGRQAEPTADPIDVIFTSIAAKVKTFSSYLNTCKSRTFAIVSEVEMTDILQETKPMDSL